MKQYEPHPLAATLPEMTPAEFAAFKADIAKCNGPRDPGVLLDNKILDGRHRARACEELGLKMIWVKFDKAWGDPVDYIYSKALHRNLNDSQKACAAAKLEPEFAKLAAAREKAGTAINAGDTKGKAVDQVGGLFGVSGRYVADAKKLLNSHPKLFQQVFEGKLPISQAVRETKRKSKEKALKQMAAAVGRALPISDRWQIVTGDCIKELKKIADASARLVFFDPPYNIGIDYGRGAKADQLPRDKYLNWMRDVIDECFRVLTKDGSLFIMITGEYLADFELILRGAEGLEPMHRRNVIVWPDTFGNYTPHNYTNCWRAICYYTKSKDEFVWHGDQIHIPSDRQLAYGDSRANPSGKVPSNVWDGFPRLVDNAAQRVPGFPTQLPVELLERIVLAHTDPGDLIVDPFNGSGTTGVAALKHHRRYVGIEQVERNAAAARARLMTLQHEMEA